MGRLAQEFAQSAAGIGADERPEEFGGSGQRNGALRLIAHDGEVVTDGDRGSRFVQQPALAQSGLADEQECGWTAVDGDRPTQGANSVEFPCPTDERHGHGFRTIRPASKPAGLAGSAGGEIRLSGAHWFFGRLNAPAKEDTT
jgi:hypothetical protein